MTMPQEPISNRLKSTSYPSRRFCVAPMIDGYDTE